MELLESRETAHVLFAGDGNIVSLTSLMCNLAYHRLYELPASLQGHLQQVGHQLVSGPYKRVTAYRSGGDMPQQLEYTSWLIESERPVAGWSECGSERNGARRSSSIGAQVASP